MFYDKAKIYLKAGDGGDGIISFRRERFAPKGGPDGGNGGRGGSIYFKVNPQLSTLSFFNRTKRVFAPSGKNGGKNKRNGKSGQDIILEVPSGTMVFDEKTGKLLFDLINSNQVVCVAKGGRGGRGNAFFATSVRQTPNFAEKGQVGEEAELRLELKLIADVGIVGFPNVGKSTLISVISEAKPKIADYPFTTLIPNLGVVNFKGTSFVVADIPGLIEGAHKGKGLGDEFLRHIERCRFLIHLLDISRSNLKKDFLALNKELTLYSKELVKKPQIVLINKIDLIPKEERKKIFEERWEKTLPFLKIKPLLVSAATKEGIDELLSKIIKKLQTLPKEPVAKKVIPILRPQERLLKNYKIEKTKEGFCVLGKKIERIASTIDPQNSHSLAYFKNILAKADLLEKLEKIGAKEGDKIKIGRLKLKWEDF